MNNTKEKNIATIVASLLFLTAFLFNVSIFVQSSNSSGNVSINSFFSQASAEDEGGGGESGGGGGSYSWSSPIACSDNPINGSAFGAYRVCNVNGTGNSCSTSGEVTCKCNIGNADNTCNPN